MGNIFDNKLAGAYLCSCDDTIIKVNNEFIAFTGFTMGELLGKSLIEIGAMLNLNSQILLENICIKYSGYIFTKSLSAREVDISVSHDNAANVTLFTFIEKSNSRLKDKLIFVAQAFIENITGVAVYSVPDLILLKANQKYLEFMDFPYNKEENSIGKSVTEIITAFTGSQSEIIWNTVLQSKKSNYTKEFEFNPLERDITYWDFTKTPIFENGELKYIYETSIEVTKRVSENKNLQRQHKIIEEQKKELEAILENIADGITIFDNKGQYILINKSAREMYFPSSNSLEKIDEEYNHSEFYDTNGKQISSEDTPGRVMKGEKFKNMRLAVKFPHKTLQIDVSGTPIYDSEGKFTLGVICSRDMTAYYNHEGAIRNRYEFLSRMIDTFDLPVVRLSCPALKVVEVNKKAFNFIKLLKPYIKSTNEIKDNTLEGLFEVLKTNEYTQCISAVLKEKKTKYLNKQKLFINDNEIYWNVIFEPILEMNGEIQEVLVLVIDVTAEITSNIIMEKALKAQGEFLVNISHELKTPLNVIFAAVQLFSMYCDSGSLDDKMSSIIKYLESIKQNSYRLNKLINNIIDLSKIESGFFELNLSNNNIVEVVEEIVMSITTFTDSKGLNIIFDTDVEEKIIACDPEKIERIVLNLISNAIKFSGQGGEILVSIKNIEDSVQISVEDNGIGIEGKYLDMIFDRFKQVDKSLSRNAEGTGIGLSLVKSIVELHGGYITVESEIGRGSKFTVILPSRSVSNENMIYSSIVKSEKQTIQVELSDVY
jgi:signal transduction histidine kinase